MTLKVEDEAGDMRSQQDIEFRQHCEHSKPQVVWNRETRCFLSTSETETLVCDLASCSTWPVETTRVTSPIGTKGKYKDTDVRLSQHGVAYMDLSSFLYPNTTQVFGAYPVIRFSEMEQRIRTECRHTNSILDLIHPKPNPNGIEYRTQFFAQIFASPVPTLCVLHVCADHCHVPVCCCAMISSHHQHQEGYKQSTS